MFKMYEVGDLVKCIDRTEVNHEKLILGKVYEVVGYSSLDGNIVYTVKDEAGTMFFTMDRFEMVKSKTEVPMDEALETMPIRCDMEVKVMPKKVRVDEFKVGDIVEVVNTGAVYSTYKDWYTQYMSESGVFIDCEHPIKGKHYEVIVVADHGCFGHDINGIRDIGGNEKSQVFIIGNYGLELVERPIKREVTIMLGQEKKQTCAGVGLTTLDPMFMPVDNVNHPSHYTEGGIETIDYIQAKLTEEGFKGYLVGNITKYISRAGKKGSEVEDLLKAEWYLKKLITTYEPPMEDATPCNSAITQKQIGYIAGLTKKLELDRYNLPEYVSPLSNYKELTEAEATAVIDRLLAIREYKGGIR